MPEMNTVNVQLIVIKFLQENGYDGLFAPDSLCCGCKIGEGLLDHSPICSINCQPGFLSVDPEDENDWVICKKKPKGKDKNV